MGSFMQGSSSFYGGDPSQAAANNVRISGGAKGMSGPSMGDLISGMGGRLDNEGQQQAFDGFMAALSAPFTQMTNNLISGGLGVMDTNPALQHFGQVTGQEIQPPSSGIPEQGILQPPPAPELSAYEQRIQELMKNRGWTREEAVLNQQDTLRQGGDFNNDGAVSNEEWAKFRDAQGLAALPAWDQGGREIHYGLAPDPGKKQTGLLGNFETGRANQGLSNLQSLFNGDWKSIKKYQRPDS